MTQKSTEINGTQIFADKQDKAKITKIKSQISNKSQIPNYLRFDAWDLFDAWCLEFEIFKNLRSSASKKSSVFSVCKAPQGHLSERN